MTVVPASIAIMTEPPLIPLEVGGTVAVTDPCGAGNAPAWYVAAIPSGPTTPLTVLFAPPPAPPPLLLPHAAVASRPKIACTNQFRPRIEAIVSRSARGGV